PHVGRPEVAVLVDGDAGEGDERPLRGGAAVDGCERDARPAELLDEVRARVADVHGTARGVDGDARREHELPGARARDAGLATLRAAADLALRLPVRDTPPPGCPEVASGVEHLDARVAGIGDVHEAGALIDRHADGTLELAAMGAG